MTRDWDTEQKDLEDKRTEAFADMRRFQNVGVTSSENEPALPQEVQRHENAKEDLRRLVEDRDRRGPERNDRGDHR